MGSYLDALVVKVRDGSHVINKSAHIAVGVDMDGVKHVLEIWIQASGGAKVLGRCLRRPGSPRCIRDVLIVLDPPFGATRGVECDGLTGLPDAIEATWKQATVQTCLVLHGHLPARSAWRNPGGDAVHELKGPQGDRTAFNPIYTAVDADAAKAESEASKKSPLGQK
ncbi:transposase [Arthrobacter sp. NPDC093128]|uniref:transposase n=1 Tax=Arthrobacter sp. NPDC093128 TaxID=3154979 RepID=UPI003430316C